MIEAMNTSTNSNNGYPIFMPNQVLSNDDLNAVVAYLNSRSLVTRSQLIGQGIVRGMEVSGDLGTATNPATLKVTAGVGLTADGQVIVLENDTTLKYYKPKNNLTSIELFEESGKNRLPLRQHPKDNSNSGQLEPTDRPDAELDHLFKTHVLQVLRDQEDTIRPTNLLSYNEMGRDRQFYLRFFLVPKDEIDRPTAQDDSASLAAAWASIAPPTLPRFGYAAGQDASSSSMVRLWAIRTDQALQANYLTLCERAIASLHTAIQDLCHWMRRIPALSEQIPSIQALENLKARFQQQLKTQSDGQQGHPYFHQYFYDYLHQIAAAHRELADAVFEFASDRDRPPSPVPKANFLLLGCVQKPELLSPDPDRHHFVPTPVEDGATQQQTDRLLYLLKRLLRLAQPEAFSLPHGPKVSIRITPSGDRAQPLSQQAIPYYLNYESVCGYWNYDAFRKGKLQAHPAYFSPREPHPLIYPLDAYGIYRIEGHLGQSCRVAFEQIHREQQDYNLAFDVICLRLNPSAQVDEPEETEQAREEQERLHHFHHFAQLYPGMEHVGGVPKGGTFILVYVDHASEGDVIIADFSLPYAVGQDTPRLQAPPSFVLSIEKNQFKADDAKAEITLLPANGRVYGQGVQGKSGQFAFHPRQLQSDPNKQVEVAIAAQWGRHVKTLTVKVYALPLARFWLGTVQSGPDSQGNEVSVVLDKTSLPIPLTPQNQGGRFRVFKQSDTEEVNQGNLLQTNPLAFVPQNFPSDSAPGRNSVVIEYKLESDGGEYKNSITVRIRSQDDSGPPARPSPENRNNLGREPTRTATVLPIPNPSAPSSPNPSSPNPNSPLADALLTVSSLFRDSSINSPLSAASLQPSAESTAESSGSTSIIFSDPPSAVATVANALPLTPPTTLNPAAQNASGQPEPPAPIATQTTSAIVPFDNSRNQPKRGFWARMRQTIQANRNRSPRF